MSVARVLVVDDSAFMRVTLTRLLSEDPELQVVGTARDGIDALEKVEALRPDVITLDVEMPRMDGLEFLRQLMMTRPTPVVMLSSLTQEGADTTVEALALGAVDFASKPQRLTTIHQISDDLVAKVKRAARARVVQTTSPRRPAIAEPGPTAISSARAGSRGAWQNLLVIGSSTGGPRALRQVLSGLPADLPTPVLVVQHMPPGFTRSLAANLDQCTPLRVREAAAGDVLERGVALVAPGGYHMTPTREGVIRLDQGPTVNGVRPSVDVTLLGTVAVYGGHVLAVVLTGMGRDGLDGAMALKRAGGIVLAEHESTCVVYGMPRSIVEAGLADEVAPIDQMADAILRHLGVLAAAESRA